MHVSAAFVVTSVGIAVSMSFSFITDVDIYSAILHSLFFFLSSSPPPLLSLFFFFFNLQKKPPPAADKPTMCREFLFQGLKLPDPNPQMNVEDVRDVRALKYRGCLILSG